MLARFYDAQNVSFAHNPNGGRLPDNIGEFDFIILSAVYEHLLPDERKTLIPVVWSHLRPGGILFVNQLPHRYSPIEAHTTGLPLINYLPDVWAAYVARRFSDQIADDEAWETMLRRGIRGGTATEILDRLGESPNPPTLLEPSRLGINDRVELWCAVSSGSRWPKIKSGVKVALKAFRRATGITFVPVLSLAIQKQPINRGMRNTEARNLAAPGPT